MFGSPTPPSSARRNAPILLEVRDPAGMTGRAAWRERGWADLWDLLEQDATGLRELAGTLDAYPQKAFLGSGWIVLSNCFPSRGEADAALSAVREEIGRRLDDHGKGTSG